MARASSTTGETTPDTASSPSTTNVPSPGPSTTANPTSDSARSLHRSPTAPPPTPRPSFLKRSWQKLGITEMVLMFMLKGSIAPTIALAFRERASVEANYLNFGYVSIIISITTVPILPRGKFLMNLIISVVFLLFSHNKVFTHIA